MAKRKSENEVCVICGKHQIEVEHRSGFAIVCDKCWEEEELDNLRYTPNEKPTITNEKDDGIPF